MSHRKGVYLDHGAVREGSAEGTRGTLVQVPSDEAGQGRKVIATPAEAPLHAFLHKFIVHTLHY